MSDFEAPPGPPPPKAPDVPAGWTARYNQQYKEWFYVNLYTKKSQWDKPTGPAVPDDDAPDGPPPSYAPGDRPTPTDSKKNLYDDPDNQSVGGRSKRDQEDEDARLARQLQDEEDARARGSPGGEAASYANTPMPGGFQGGQPPSGADPAQDQRSGSRGLLGKLLGRKTGASGSPYPQQQPYGGGYPGQQPYGGGPGYGPGYGGYGPPPGPPYGGGYGGGYGGYQQQQPSKRPGMGAMGGAALGLGAGLLGGALIEEGINHAENQGYDQGYQQGYDNGDNGNNGDFGGGGGDGGDFGGGGDF